VALLLPPGRRRYARSARLWHAAHASPSLRVMNLPAEWLVREHQAARWVGFRLLVAPGVASSHARTRIMGVETNVACEQNGWQCHRSCERPVGLCVG